MLVITQRTEDFFNIGPDVTIKILSVRSGQVKIGISAPKDVNIWRDNAKSKKIRIGEKL